jgi:hypothetical protein
MPTRARPLLLALGIAASATACGREATSLLARAHPSRASGISTVDVLTDGRSAPDGDDWNGAAAAVLESPAAFVEYDLGRSARIRGAYLQGDNNDEYVVSASEDGQAFHEIWVAPPVAAPGLRGRSTDGLDAQGRWLRLSGRGGDGRYSIAELQIFEEPRGMLSPSPGRPSGETRAASLRSALVYLVLAFGLLLFATGARSSSRRLLLLWLLAGAVIVVVLAALADAWPPGGREVSFARAAAAAIALLALGRAAGWFARGPAHRPTVIGAAVVAAALAFACFYNLGQPQFWNHARKRPLFVHTVDMRMYQPFVKYFPELRYDGVYLASVLAFAEDERGGSLASLGTLEIRDQRDHRMRRVSELGDDLREVRARFSDARWQSFKSDMTFFREAMGPEYLTLSDHGANAPPVWVWLARLPLGHVVASETSLTVAGLIDAVLFLAMAVALWLCFGPLPTLAAMTVFGATELYMFGTNWGGATLRHDWLALLAFGACALKRERWALAGVLLGLSTMLRAFPVVALFGVALPPLAWFAERWARGRRPSLGEVIAAHRGAVAVLAAAAATIAFTFVATGFLYSFSAWGEWWRKITLLNADLAVNEVNLRALVAGSDGAAAELMRSRRLLYLAAQLACFGVFVVAAKRRPLHEAMLLALPLTLVIFHPVNYHLHLVFLLVLVVAGGDLLASAAPLLVLCVAGTFAALDPDADRRFQLHTVLLFAALGWFYANVIRANRRPGDSLGLEPPLPSEKPL